MGARRTSCPPLALLGLLAISLAVGCSTSDRRGSDVFQRDLPKVPRSAASSAGRAAAAGDAPAQPEPVTRADGAGQLAETDAPPQRSAGEAPGAVAQSAAEQARLLTAALEQLNEPQSSLAAHESRPSTASSAGPEQPTRTPEGAPQPDPAAQAPHDPQQPGPDAALTPPPASEPAAPESIQADSTSTASPPPTRQALLAQLRESIRSSDQPAADKALALATLTLIDGAAAPDETDLASLPAPQRDRLASFQHLIRLLAEQWSSPSSTSDAQAVVDQFSHLLGSQPLTIHQARLCLSVKGFGVYDELPSPSLQAGREHRLIVYVELDHFETTPTSGLFRVKLSQEIEVYTEADGLCVWRLPRVEVVDESRNRRRDFFTAQLVRLPPNLGVGRYRLKVRLTDLANNNCDEASIPFQIVADRSIATGG